VQQLAGQQDGTTTAAASITEVVSMASCGTSATVQCPECKELVVFPATARHTGKTTVSVTIDPAPIRDHLASHEARFTMELPPTAR
jgi:phage FluMu protein Com